MKKVLIIKMEKIPTKLTEEHYDIIRKLGSGSSGDVYLALDRQGNIVAIKMILLNEDEDYPQLEMEFKNLITLSKPQCHPNIVCYYDAYKESDSDFYCFVTQYYDGETFDFKMGLLTRNNEYYQLMLYILIKLLKALDYIHGKNIVHGDIKPENIIIQENFEPVLIDFGLSCQTNNKTCNNFSGTPLYIAPELFRSYNADDDQTLKLTPKSDIWSLGTSFYSVLVSDEIWIYDEKNQTLGEHIASGSQKLVVQTSNSILNELLNKMIIYDPHLRPSAPELLYLYGILLQTQKRESNPAKRSQDEYLTPLNKKFRF